MEKGMNLRLKGNTSNNQYPKLRYLAEYHQSKNKSSAITDYLFEGKDISLYRICIRRFIELRWMGKMNEMGIDGNRVKIQDNQLILDNEGNELAVPLDVQEMIMIPNTSST